MTAAAIPQLSLAGISHRTAPVPVLERLALAPEEIAAFYDQIAARADIQDALLISTCNRTEVYALSEPAVDATAQLTDALQQVAGAQRFPDASHLYRLQGRASIEHLFRVACGLDSMVLGEAQILGQVREAYENSCQRRRPSRYFDDLLQAAFKVAGRSRHDTEIGRGAVSIASAAAHLAGKVFADLSRRRIVVVGAGDTARLAAEHFAGQQPRHLCIVNRTLANAEKIAQPLGAEAAPWDGLHECTANADVLAVAVRVSEPTIRHGFVSEVMQARPGRALAIFDLGLPRNVEATCNKIANVFLHDLDALRQVIDHNLEHRRLEIPKVERIIKEQADRLLAGYAGVKSGPLIRAMRDGVEAIRQAEIKRASAGLSDTEIAAVDRVTRAIVNKLLHGPTTAIKDFADQQKEGSDRLQVIKSMFSNLESDHEED